MTEYVGFQVSRDVDLPDCPDCEADTTRVMGHGPKGKEPPLTPWCIVCGWRGEPIDDYTDTVPVVDIRSLDGVPDDILKGGRAVPTDALDALDDRTVAYADPPTAVDKLAHALDDR